jgi:hypothetical protein
LGAVNPNNIVSNSILPTDQIGMGINGGVMGGWINSPIYGMYVKGYRYGLYTDGQSYSNNIVVQLIPNKNSPDQLIPTYTSTSTTVNISTMGMGTLVNGKATIRFDENFANSISDKYPVNVTVTPMGNSNGVYVSEISTSDFVITENNNGTSNVTFNWVAIGVKQNYENPTIPQELLSTTYNQNMSNVMIPDDISKKSAIPIWWDGSNIHFNSIPAGFTNTGVKMKAKTPVLKQKPKVNINGISTH